MGSRVDQLLQGFALLDPRFTASNLAPNDGTAPNSDYSENTPRPGDQAATSGTLENPQGVVEIRNSQDSDSWVVVSGIGGAIGREAGARTTRSDSTASNNGALAYYRREPLQNNDQIPDRVGFGFPFQPGHYSIASYAVTVGVNVGRVAAVTLLESGEPVVASGPNEPGGGGAKRFDTASGTWVPYGFLGLREPSSSIHDRTIVAIPGNQILYVGLSEAHALNGAFGTGTELVARYDAPALVSYDPETIRAAYNDGEICLLTYESSSGEIIQRASDDLAGSFVTIVDQQPALGAGFQLFALPGGGFGIVDAGPPVGALRFRRIGSAFDDVRDASVSVIVGSGIFPTRVAACADLDGTIWVLASRDGADFAVYASWDLGETWLEQQDGELYDSRSVGRMLNHCQLTSSVAGFCLAHQHTSDGATHEETVGAWLVGGWQNWIGRVSMVLDDSPGGGNTDAYSWLPFDLPDAGPFTLLGTPGVFGPSGMTITTAASTGAYARQLLGSGPADWLWVFAEFGVASGGSQVTTQAGFSLRWGDGASETQLAVRADTNGFTVADVNGGNLFSRAVDLTVEPVQFWAMVRGSAWFVAWRRAADPFWEIYWDIDFGIPSLTNVGPGVSFPDVVFGNVANGTAVTYWRQFHSALNRNNTQAATRIGTPGAAFYRDYLGRWLSPEGAWVPAIGTDDRGAILAATRGPLRSADEYRFDPEYDYPVSALFPRESPSPYAPWRSADLSEQFIAVEFSAEGSKLDGSRILAAAMLRTNCRYIQIDAWRPSSGTWVNVGNVNLSQGFEGLDYVLTGNILYPAPTTADGARYIQAGEFVGGYVEVATSGGVRARRIASNTAGFWTADTTNTPTPLFRLEGIDGTEDPLAVCRIRAPSGVVTWATPVLGVQLESKYRIHIDPILNIVAEDYFEIGSAFVGAVWGLGRRWNRGYSRAMLPNISSRRDPWGTIRRTKEGPPPRRWVQSWQDGEDLIAIRQTTDADYHAPAGQLPVIARDDIWFQLFGILEGSEGTAAPVLCLAAIPDANNQTITDRTLFLYGYLTGTAQANVILGNEGENEAVRVESLTVEEIV